MDSDNDSDNDVDAEIVYARAEEAATMIQDIFRESQQRRFSTRSLDDGDDQDTIGVQSFSEGYYLEEDEQYPIANHKKDAASADDDDDDHPHKKKITWKMDFKSDEGDASTTDDENENHTKDKKEPPEEEIDRSGLYQAAFVSIIGFLMMLYDKIMKFLGCRNNDDVVDVNDIDPQMQNTTVSGDGGGTGPSGPSGPGGGGGGGAAPMPPVPDETTGLLQKAYDSTGSLPYEEVRDNWKNRATSASV